jgi:hypothetical protein
MKTLIALLSLALLPAVVSAQTTPVQEDARIAAARAAGDRIVADLLAAESTVKTQAAEIAALKQQLAAAQAATTKAISERDAAVKARTDAKTTVTAVQQQLAAAAAKL